MKCPACHYQETKVVDSRVAPDGMAIRRRRECLRCEFRFSTHEEIEILDLSVIKRNGKKEAYSHPKLEKGVMRAFEKRPITQDDFKKLIHNIERDIQIKKRNEIKSEEIGDLVMERLKKFDEVAYIRFASVYHSFKDAKSFQKELNKLVKKQRNKKTRK